MKCHITSLRRYSGVAREGLVRNVQTRTLRKHASGLLDFWDLTLTLHLFHGRALARLDLGVRGALDVLTAAARDKNDSLWQRVTRMTGVAIQVEVRAAVVVVVVVIVVVAAVVIIPVIILEAIARTLATTRVILVAVLRFLTGATFILAVFNNSATNCNGYATNPLHQWNSILMGPSRWLHVARLYNTFSHIS